MRRGRRVASSDATIRRIRRCPPGVPVPTMCARNAIPASSKPPSYPVRPHPLPGGSVMHPHVHAQRTPDKPAIIMAGGTVITYRELDERSNQVARLFRDHGLQPGDRVAFLLENHP